MLSPFPPPASLVLHSGSWKSLTFKAYNFDAMGVAPARGHLHPLMKVRTEIRQIFLEMGLVVLIWQRWR